MDRQRLQWPATNPGMPRIATTSGSQKGAKKHPPLEPSQMITWPRSVSRNVRQYISVVLSKPSLWYLVMAALGFTH